VDSVRVTVKSDWFLANAVPIPRSGQGSLEKSDEVTEKDRLLPTHHFI